MPVGKTPVPVAGTKFAGPPCACVGAAWFCEEDEEAPRAAPLRGSEIPSNDEFSAILSILALFEQGVLLVPSGE